ncbi:hypothetical protein KGQ20_09375 [Catenulispora sp. NF23]|uniref:hypothetical protein n=1 Tax=Catenulispora pinistramenti TaxID=2705254 RepID=UPI001BA7C3E8|nr:hypothetical protein [Catenulispora pinistramenti]MBS2532985.1 hypothetical protein [Catenulispora pinistramenti]
MGDSELSVTDERPSPQQVSGHQAQTPGPVEHALGRTPSLAERRAEAARILSASPARSDREVGRVVGLSAGTVSAVRRGLGEQRAARVRIGGDGRARPVNADEGRRAAAQLLAERPDIPVRAIARAAGISLGTAHDVRRRVLAGLPPVPAGRAVSAESSSGSEHDSQAAAQNSGSEPGSETGPGPGPSHGPASAMSPGRRPQSSAAADRALRHDPAAALDALRRDPALRYSETGRTILRRLDAQLLAAGELIELCAHVPPHCGDQVEALLRYIGEACVDAARVVQGTTRGRKPRPAA